MFLFHGQNFMAAHKMQSYFAFVLIIVNLINFLYTSRFLIWVTFSTREFEFLSSTPSRWKRWTWRWSPPQWSRAPPLTYYRRLEWVDEFRRPRQESRFPTKRPCPPPANTDRSRQSNFHFSTRGDRQSAERWAIQDCTVFVCCNTWTQTSTTPRHKSRTG